jgi:hypothetical protein
VKYDALYANLHVGKCEIWCAGTQAMSGMSFIADGVLYGPFEGVRVKNLTKIEKKIKIEYCSEKLILEIKRPVIDIGIIKCAAILYPSA